MLKLNKKISNPISVIAIFAFISETSAAISLPFLNNSEREIYVWFLISFPFYLILLFFITLNFNYRALYAPSDFDNDKNFLKAFEETTPPTPDASSDYLNSGAHHIKLPKPFSEVYLIDTRQKNTNQEIEVLLGKIPHPNKHSPRLFLFLTDAVSDILLNENIARSAKQARTPQGTTYCSIYNTQSSNISVLGKL